MPADAQTLPRHEPHPDGSLISLGNRIALVFGAITLVAIVTVYMIVVPGLQGRLLGEGAGHVSGGVYRAPISNVVHNVDTVRHQILVAGGIALRWR